MEKYELGQRLGSGGEAVVWRVTRRNDGAPLVLKRRACMDFSEANSGLAEAVALARFQHPSVVRYEDLFIERDPDDRDSLFLCIAMEYCTGGDLCSLLCKQREEGLLLPRKRLHRFVRQLAGAVAAIHAARLVHRDLKLENCFLDACDNVKIGDFGLCMRRQRPGVYSSSAIGTPAYMAPELLRVPCSEGEVECTPAVDVWALGCVYYELATLASLAERRTPLAEDDAALVLVPDAIRLAGEEQLADLVETMLHPDPFRRPSIDAVLEHSFFSDTVETTEDELTEGSESAPPSPRTMSPPASLIYAPSPLHLASGADGSELEVRALTSLHRHAAIDIVAAGLREDPRFKSQVAKDKLVARVSKMMATTLVVYFTNERTTLGLFENGQLVSLLLLAPPKKKPDLQVMTRVFLSKGGLFKSKGAITALMRMNEHRRFLFRKHNFNFRRPHWWLYFIATRNDCRGRGYGATLMGKLIKWADADDVVCVAEVGMRQHLPFFERHGFALQEEVFFVDQLASWPDYLVCVREPKSVREKERRRTAMHTSTPRRDDGAATTTTAAVAASLHLDRSNSGRSVSLPLRASTPSDPPPRAVDDSALLVSQAPSSSAPAASSSSSSSSTTTTTTTRIAGMSELAAHLRAARLDKGDRRGV